MPNALVRSIRRRVATQAYPAVSTAPPARLRGRPALIADTCPCDTEEAACVRACPTGAISLRPGWQVDLGACLFCGLCAEACPTGALHLTGDFELAVRSREDLHVGPQGAPASRVPAYPAPEHAPLAGAPAAHLAQAGEVERLSARLRGRISRSLRRSLHIRHLDAGSCNGCDWELTALLNPVHDMQRLGFDFVASPRHADLLLVTGAMTHHLETAVRRTYEAMPEPRLVVAVGACGCSGGLFTPNYAGGGGVDRVLPVDVYVPGCPPRPEALLYGLLLAVERVEQRLGAARTGARPAGADGGMNGE